jgi:hypothetical protein
MAHFSAMRQTLARLGFRGFAPATTRNCGGEKTLIRNNRHGALCVHAGNVRIAVSRALSEGL